MSLETEIREAFERHSADAMPAGDTWTGIEGRIQRSHRTRMVFSGAGAAIAIAAIAFAAPRLVADTVDPILPRPVPASTPVLHAKIPVPGFALAAGDDAIWTLVGPKKQGDLGRLSRIDPKTNRETASAPVGFSPAAVAAGEGAIWVTNGRGCNVVISCGDGTPQQADRFPQQNSLMRFDPNTNKLIASIKIREPQDVATGFGSVWVTAAEESDRGTMLLRIDPATNAVVSRMELGTDTGFFAYITIGEDHVWVTSSPSSVGGDQSTTVQHFDPATNAPVPPIMIFGTEGTAPLAAGHGAVWVAVPGTNSASGLKRIDPATGEIAATVVLPDAAPVGLRAVTTGGGYVWATSGRGYLWKVDPEVNAPAGDPILIGDAPPVSADDVVFGFDSIWVTAGDGKIWRFIP